MKRTPIHPPKGFVFVDMVTAILLVGALAAASVATITARNRARQRLADDRAALRISEQVLAQLRAPKPRADAGEGGTIEIHRLATPSGIDGKVWAEVRVTLRTGSATLRGLAPESEVRE